MNREKRKILKRRKYYK